MDKEQLEGHFKAMVSEYESESCGAFPIEVFNEVLADSIKNKMRAFVATRTGHLNISGLMDLQEISKKPKTEIKKVDETKAKPAAETPKGNSGRAKLADKSVG